MRQALRGKQILLIGVTGFIGKVWLEHILSEVPEIGKIYLLIRRQRNTTARRRFEKIVEESPVFDRLEERYGAGSGPISGAKESRSWKAMSASPDWAWTTKAATGWQALSIWW